MTEAEWLVCTDPQVMSVFLRGRASQRKVRLFSVACCRRIWRLFSDERNRNAVEVGERFADGNATSTELAAAHDLAFEDVANAESTPHSDTTDDYAATKAAVHSACPDGRDYGFGPLPYNTLFAFYHASRPSALAVAPGDNFKTELAAHAHLLRDIFGNPFRPVAPNPAWRTSTVEQLAVTIYTDRAFDRLPILADALEDAGCTSQAILSHLRGPGPHTRGCWALDLLRGKE